MKRGICLILAAQLMLLAACGSDAGTGNETTSGSVNSGDTTVTDDGGEKTRLDELGARDLGGRDFVIMDANDYPSRSMNIYDAEITGDTVNDAIHNRDNKISELYNVRIKYERPENAAEGCKTLSQAFLAGDNICDIVYSRGTGSDGLLSLVSQRALANLEDIEYLSFDKPWWSGFAYENLNLGGKLYFAIGDLMSNMYVSPVVMTANLSLLEQYAPDEDIYDLVNEGRWTIDKLIEFTKFNNDLDGDGVLHTANDFFGLVGDMSGGGLAEGAFVVAEGVDLCHNDGETITVSLTDEHTADVVSKVAKLPPHEKMNDRWEYVKTFKEDRSIFLQTYMDDVVNSMRDMDSDYLILPAPKYDEAQENYKCLVNGWTACFMGIMANADVDEAGFIAEALGYESYIVVRPEVYEKLLKQKAARDERSTAMVELMFDSLTIDFNALCDFGGTVGILGKSIYKDTPLASALAKKQEATDDEIAKFTDNWLQK